MFNEFFLESFAPINAYGHGNRDEFHYDNSGIFKVYSPVVIPFLMEGKIDFLNKTWSKIKKITKDDYTFEQALDNLEEGKEIKQVLNNYVEKSLSDPEYFKESLETARRICLNNDRRLTEIFSEEQLPDDPKEKLGKLMGRLCAGFCASAPFYDLEAIVDNDKTRGKKFMWNPVLKAEEEIENIVSKVKRRVQNSNKDPELIYKITDGLRVEQSEMELLDKYEGLGILPGLFSGHLEKNEIRGWDDIRNLLNKIKNEDQITYETIRNISEQVNRPEEDVTFAGYILTSLSKSKLTKDEAIEMIKRTENVNKDAKNEITTAIDSLFGPYLTPGEFIRLKKLTKVLRIAEETNGLIRFYNWLPLVKDDSNIEGRNLIYASVCDTSNQIFAALKENPRMFRKEDDYQNFLKSIKNIKNVDASSAKGRWFLRFIENTDSIIKDGIMKIADREKEKYLTMLLG